jgi:hypothetical protein
MSTENIAGVMLPNLLIRELEDSGKHATTKRKFSLF